MPRDADKWLGLEETGWLINWQPAITANARAQAQHYGQGPHGMLDRAQFKDRVGEASFSGQLLPNVIEHTLCAQCLVFTAMHKIHRARCQLECPAPALYRGAAAGTARSDACEEASRPCCLVATAEVRGGSDSR